MRRAEWRRRADDPKTALGWWWRGVTIEGGLFLFASVVLSLSTVLAMIGFGWALIPLAISGIVVCIYKRVTLTDRLKALLPDPAPEGQFRATVTYRRDGMVTGRDEMALTVVDGWLVGEGVRSDFALRSGDVRALRVTGYGARLALSDGGEVRLLGVLDPGQTELGGWHDGGVLPEGEPTFPPARAHEREIARLAAWWPFGMAVAWLPSVVGVYLGVRHPLNGPLLAPFLIGSAISVLGESRGRRLKSLDTKARKEEVVHAGAAPTIGRGDVECGASAPLGSGASAPRPLGGSERTRR